MNVYYASWFVTGVAIAVSLGAIGIIFLLLNDKIEKHRLTRIDKEREARAAIWLHDLPQSEWNTNLTERDYAVEHWSVGSEKKFFQERNEGS